MTVNRFDQEKQRGTGAGDPLTSSLSSHLSRRSLLVRGAALGLSVPAVAGLLAACGEAEDDAEPGSSDDSEDADAADDESDAGDDDSSEDESSDSDSAGDGSTLIFNNGTNPSDLDPQTTGAVASWYVLDNIFDRLVRLDPDSGEPVESLAEGYEVSDDGLEYTFTLREGVTFHNGREMTSEDVQYSIERIMDPDVPAAAKPYFSSLDSIEIPDDYTVVLTYTEVFAPLIIALTRLETAIVPQEEVETEGWASDVLVGTGPFKFDSFVKDDAAILVRNDDYWGEPVPEVGRVEHRIIPEAETALVSVRTGDIHVTEIEPKDIEEAESEDGVTVEMMPTTFWPHLSVNCGVEPFDDVRVRQAIRLGVNREDIRELAFYGTGLISNTLFPEGNPFRAEVDGWDYDPDAARELLEEAGFGDGFSAVLRISTGTPWQSSSAQIVQENLLELNIEVEIEQIESTTWFSEVFNNSEFEMTMVAHVSKVDPDLSMLDILHGGEYGTKNYTQFNDSEMDELLEAGRATVDTEERTPIYADAQKIFVERSGYIVLNLQEQAWAVRDEVQGFTLLTTGELRWKGASLNG